jgi:arsenate reductase
MAHGFLQSFDKYLIVRSAGTQPAKQVNQTAAKVMQELGIDIYNHTPELVDKYTGEEWDYVITVCDDANETCPAFLGKVKHRIHMGFEDPSHKKGTPEYVMSEYYRIRDLIKEQFHRFYQENLSK